MSKDEAAEVLSIGGRDVRISHPEKLYFSREVKLTKLDLVRYYLSVAGGMPEPGGRWRGSPTGRWC